MPATEFLRPDVVESRPLQVVVVDNVQDFGELRAEWTELLSESTADCPFVTWEWLYSWWTHLRGARTLRLLTLRTAAGRLIGIAPLSLSHGGLPWLSRLEFLGTGWAGSDYLDLIAHRGCTVECAEAFVEWLRAEKRTVRLDH